MTPVHFANRLRDASRRFGAAEQGNLAVMFAIVLVPILSFVGAAIDYSRASNARTAMQAAADSAALMVSRDIATGLITDSQVTSKAQTYFNALYSSADVSGVAITASYTPKDSKGASTVLVNGTATIPTDFMRVVGYPSLALNTASTATWGGTRLRVAMALDVTGSMKDDGKMKAMQDAAKSLIDTLAGMAKTTEDVYVSVVPFAQMVNVGKSNKKASWLNWDSWEEVNGKCSSSYYSTQSSCESHGKNWTADNHKNWDGCVTDRDQPYDTTKDGPTSSATDFIPIQYEQSGSSICPAAILPMTSVSTAANVTVVKDTIDGLSPNGGTNQPIGMAWAWTTLQTGAPFPAPAKDSNYQYTDTIILLSDGLNTIDRWYGNGSDPSSQVDDRQKLLCDNIKVKDATGKAPQIFTIQVNTGGDAESSVLRYCADSGQFYPTSTTAGIAGAFRSIGTMLAKLRVAK